MRSWIRILPSTSKKIKKTLISTVLCLLNGMLSLKTDVNEPKVSNMQDSEPDPDPAPDPGSAIQSRIQDSGSVSKCQGPGTQEEGDKFVLYGAK